MLVLAGCFLLVVAMMSFYSYSRGKELVHLDIWLPSAQDKNTNGAKTTRYCRGALIVASIVIHLWQVLTGRIGDEHVLIFTTNPDWSQHMRNVFLMIIHEFNLCYLALKILRTHKLFFILLLKISDLAGIEEFRPGRGPNREFPQINNVSQTSKTTLAAAAFAIRWSSLIKRIPTPRASRSRQLALAVNEKSHLTVN